MRYLVIAVAVVSGAYVLLVASLWLRYQLPNLISVALDQWAVRRYERIISRWNKAEGVVPQ